MNDEKPRIVSWFSCGAASAVATKLAIRECGNRVVPAYCDPGAEDEDNERFLRPPLHHRSRKRHKVGRLLPRYEARVAAV
jgi:hypothetical protein